MLLFCSTSVSAGPRLRYYLWTLYSLLEYLLLGPRCSRGAHVLVWRFVCLWDRFSSQVCVILLITPALVFQVLGGQVIFTTYASILMEAMVVLESSWVEKKKWEPHLHEFRLEVPELCLKVTFIHSYLDELQQNMGFCRTWITKMKISFKQMCRGILFCFCLVCFCFLAS